MLAEEHKEISNFIMEYNREGTKILSKYENDVSNGPMDETYPQVDEIDPRSRKVSAMHLPW